MSELEKIRPSYEEPYREIRKNPREFFLSSGIRSVFYFCLFISGVIFLDGLLPVTESREKIEDWFILVEEFRAEEYMEEFNAASTITYKIKTSLNEFAINKNDALLLKEGDSIIIQKTPVFKTLRGFYSMRLQQDMKPYINMYGVFMVLPAFMMIFSLIGLMKKIREDVFLTFGVLNIILICSYFFIRLFYT